MPQLLANLDEKHKAAFLNHQRVALDNKLAEVNNYTARNQALPSHSSSVGPYVATRLLILESEIQYLGIYRSGLTYLHKEGKISSNEYRQERDKFIEQEIEKCHEVIPLRLELQPLGQDMREKMLSGFHIHGAYFEAMAKRKNVATGNQQKLQHIKENFVKGVLEYHAANGFQEVGREGQTWCNVLGWQPAANVEIAYIVPKLLDEEPPSHILGAKVKPSMELGNTLMLHHDIHSKLTSGDIVILPVRGRVNDWECILTNENLKKERAMNCLLWEDIHRARLQFNSINLPARRYLYFRFFMTYMKQKWIGNTAWTKEIETKTQEWPFPAQYLRDSFVEALFARMFDGELLYAFTGTFPDGAEVNDFQRLHFRNERAALWFLEVIQTLEV